MKTLWTKVRWSILLGCLIGLLAGVAAAELPPLDSDSEPDRCEWWQMEAKFGPIPAPAAGTTVGAVEKTLINEYWRLLGEGYQNLGKQFGVTVDVQAAQNEADQLGQLSIAESMLNKGYKTILASPQSDSNLQPAFDKAIKMGVPFINVNDAIIPSAINYIGNVQRDNGVRAAKWFLKTYPDGGKLAVIEGQAGVYAARQRTDGFVTTIKQDGQGKFEVVSSVPGNWDRQLAYDQAATILLQHPDLLGFYCNNDTMALGVVEAVKAANRLGKTIVIGTDGIGAAYESILAGELTGTIDSFPVLTGEVALEVALRLLGGQKLPRVVATPQALVLKANYERYKSNDSAAVRAALIEDAKAEAK